MKKSNYIVFALYAFLALTVAIIGDLSTAATVVPAAIILNGILGGGRGKVGGVIMSKWKGIDYLKAYFVPANPQSPAQTTQRTKFAAMISIAQSLLPSVIPALWDPFAVKMSGFNAFVKANIGTLSGTYHLQTSSFISKGSLEGTNFDSGIYNSTTGALDITWDTDINGNGLSDDYCSIVIYNKVTDKIEAVDLENFTRNDGTAQFTLDTGGTATDYIAFLGFRRGTGETLVVSDSVGYGIQAA